MPDDIRAVVDMQLGSSGWERRAIRLTSAAKLAYDGRMDETILRLLELFRDGKTAANTVTEIRSKPEFSSVQDHPEMISTLVHELVHHGMLMPTVR